MPVRVERGGSREGGGEVEMALLNGGGRKPDEEGHGQGQESVGNGTANGNADPAPHPPNISIPGSAGADPPLAIDEPNLKMRLGVALILMWFMNLVSSCW